MTFLKKSVDALHNKLQKEQAEHHRNRIGVMEVNQKLIEDIKLLQHTIETLKTEFSNCGGSKDLAQVQ